MRSMTGYGRGECMLYDRKFVVEIKSVNNRYSDISIRMPRTINEYEEKIRKKLASEIYRGKIDVYINFQSFAKEDFSVCVNENLANEYHRSLMMLANKYNISKDITLDLFTRFQDILVVSENTSSDKIKEEIKETLFSAVEVALKGFIKMRETEGEVLFKDIIERLLVVKNINSKILELAPVIEADYKSRIISKIEELTSSLDIDNNRVLTEVAIFADKSCIVEEITRIFSHISQMEEVLSEKFSIGKKLDFIIQEINREVNTITSKVSNMEVKKHTLQLKSELEKIREQLQNIE